MFFSFFLCHWVTFPSLICYRRQRHFQRLFPPAGRYRSGTSPQRCHPKHVCGQVRGHVHAKSKATGLIFFFFSYTSLRVVVIRHVHDRSRRWPPWPESDATAAWPLPRSPSTTWRTRTSVWSAVPARSLRVAATTTTSWCTRRRFKVSTEGRMATGGTLASAGDVVDHGQAAGGDAYVPLTAKLLSLSERLSKKNRNPVDKKNKTTAI